MGGFGSGRRGGGSTQKVDDLRCLDINKLIKLSIIKDGCLMSNGVMWTNKQGEKQSSLNLMCDTLNEDNRHIHLKYNVIDTQETFDYRIDLTATKQPFGNYRLWFVCPYKRIRTSKLYLPYGGNKYASRQAYDLKHTCQSEDYKDRAIRKKWKAWDKLGDGNDYSLSRPKGMHHKTYDKLFNKAMEADTVCDNIMETLIAKHF